MIEFLSVELTFAFYYICSFCQDEFKRSKKLGLWVLQHFRISNECHPSISQNAKQEYASFRPQRAEFSDAISNPMEYLP